MDAARDIGPDWQMLQYLEEQEYQATETLALIHRELVLTGKLETESFNELVYLTGVRATFGEDNGKRK